MKLAFWGSGPISNFHVPALRQNGFEIQVCYSREGSERAKIFAEEWEIPHARTLDDFLMVASRCDAIVIALRTDCTAEAIASVANLNLPTLVEKPGALNHAALLNKVPVSFRSKLMFAYNRRYYQTTTYLKDWIARQENLQVTLTWPDSILGPYQFLVNGCHVVDWARFLLGDLEIISKESVNIDQTRGLVTMRTSAGAFVSLSLISGSPQNPYFGFHGLDESIVLRGFESLSHYDGLIKKAPEPGSNVRSYLPSIVTSMEESADSFKPGFVPQSRAFRDFVSSTSLGQNDASFTDAVAVLKVLEEIQGPFK